MLAQGGGQAFQDEFLDWLTAGAISTVGWVAIFFVVVFVVLRLSGRSSR